MKARKLKIAFFEVKDWEKAILTRRLKSCDVKFYAEPLTPANAALAKHAEVVSVFIYSRIDAATLSRIPNLQLIATRSTGFDHIDLQACRKRRVAVCNVPSYGENTVAEHTFALILALSRNVHKSYVRTLRDDFHIEGLKGFDLQGKTLGVIGAGKIGLHVIRIAKGFGMKVLAFDGRHDPFMADVLGYEYAPIEAVLARSDIITLHVPLLPATRHLIDGAAIRKMKKGALLINTSRGEVVDTDALLEGLESGKIGGAGLDVLEGEQLIKEERQLLHDKNSSDRTSDLVRDHLLLRRDNVVFTPHIAFYSQEALERILETTAANIGAFEDGRMQNEVK